MWSFIVWLTATEWSTVILHACIPFRKIQGFTLSPPVLILQIYLKFLL